MTRRQNSNLALNFLNLFKKSGKTIRINGYIGKQVKKGKKASIIKVKSTYSNVSWYDVKYNKDLSFSPFIYRSNINKKPLSKIQAERLLKKLEKVND